MSCDHLNLRQTRPQKILSCGVRPVGPLGDGFGITEVIVFSHPVSRTQAACGLVKKDVLSASVLAFLANAAVTFGSEAGPELVNFRSYTMVNGWIRMPLTMRLIHEFGEFQRGQIATRNGCA